MLLQHIVETLDAELDRLYHLRQIVAEISAPFAFEVDNAPLAVLAPVADEPEAPPPSPATVPKAPRKVARKARAAAERVSKPKRRSAGEITPLKGTIPAGPVVVSPAALKQEHAARKASQPERPQARAQEPRGSLGSMIRALRLDRGQ